MTSAMPGARVGREDAVPAPISGVQLGVGEAGPVSLRMFRLRGTRVAVVGLLEAAQLLAVRAAAAGTPVDVVTPRGTSWTTVLPHNPNGRVVGDTAGLAAHGGPSLLIDDSGRPGAGIAERAPWQCVLTIRARWGADDLQSIAYHDLALFGAVPVQLVSAVASVFAIPRAQADRLSHVPPGSVVLLRRKSMVPVQLNPTGAEYQLIEAARSAPAGEPPSAPTWRG